MTFSLKNLSDVDSLDNLMAKLFKHFLDRAEWYSDFGVEKFSIIIRSSELSRPIQIPYRDLLQNTPEVILRQVQRVAQSNKTFTLDSDSIRIEIVSGPNSVEALKGVIEYSGAGQQRQVHHYIRTSSLIKIINPNSTDCLFRALELTRLHHLLPPYSHDQNAHKEFSRMVNDTHDSYHRKRANLVKELLDGIEADPSLPTIPRDLAEYNVSEHLPIVQQFYDHKYGEGKFRICVFENVGQYRPVWKAENSAERSICIFHTTDDFGQGHFEGIRNINGFFKKYKYCIDCEVPYDKDQTHASSCKAKCLYCGGVGYKFPCKPDGQFKEKCAVCRKTFTNQDCFDRHKAKMCALYHKCLECGLSYNASKKHECGTKFCHTCNTHHKVDKNGKNCYVQVIEPPKKDVKHSVIVCYDIETANPGSNIGEFMHKPNLICAQVMCTKCMDSSDELWKEPDTGNCKICSPKEPDQPRMHTFAALNDDDKPMEKFVDWLRSFNPEYKVIAIAHYGGKFDIHLVAAEVYKNAGPRLDMIATGNKIYQLTMARHGNLAPEIVFKDSFNWFGIKLSDVPDSFDLKIKDKMFFPHGYNQQANMHKQRKTLPKKKHYFPESFTPDKFRKFKRWYKNHFNEPFLLKAQLKEYCENDVKMLVGGIHEFRRIFMEISNDDPIVNSSTIAGACIRHYCKNVMKKDQIAIIPPGGYRKHERQSAKALKYIKWYHEQNKEDIGLIRHRDTPDGEFELLHQGRKYKVDAYILRKSTDRPLCIEFNGCAWHGCDKCNNADKVCPNGKTQQQNYEEWLKRKEVLEQYMDLHVIWEHEYDAMIKKDKAMAIQVSKIMDTGPIDNSDAYFGGNTDVKCMAVDLEVSKYMRNKYEIGCFDINSLYPAVNFYEKYPLGHPDLLNLNKDVNWTKPSDVRHRVKQIRGILKVRILPPRDLFLPVVPLRMGGKFMLPLCRTCAAEHKTRSVRRKGRFVDTAKEDICNHSVEERHFISTITHVELRFALKHGYTVDHVYDVNHWDKWTDQLFRPYTQQFMKLKLENSGYPSSVGNNAALRKHFIKKNQKKYGIKLDPNKMKRKPGFRYVAKICNNSMWGRWSLRPNLKKMLITGSPKELHTLLNDKTKEIGSLQMLSENLIAVPYGSTNDYVEPHDKYNIVLSLFTTAYARLRLYAYNDKVVKTPGCKLLYNDTDSVFCLYPKDQPCPVKTGDYLGDMAREYEDYEILAFYSAGCKQYGIKLKHRVTGKISHVVKVRGCSADRKTRQKLNFNSFRRLVLYQGRANQKPINIKRTRIQPNGKKGEVHTKMVNFAYAPVYDKGMVFNDLMTYPFGYIGSK